MQDLSDLAAAFPLSSWLSGYTTVRDGGGQNLYADCPVCQGKQKLRIRKDTGKWTCFKCDEGGHGGETWRGWGNLFQLVAFLEGLNWGEAIRFVSQRSGLPDIQLPKAARPFSMIPREALKLSDFEPDHPARTRLAARGLQHLEPHIYGCVTGKYARRWIIPCRFLDDQIHGIEAKAWSKAKQPKTLYPTWMSPQENVYTTAWDDSLPIAIVTESIFDAETFATNAVGIYGSQLLPGQFEKLLELKRRKGVVALFWALDPDAVVRQRNAILQKTLGVFKNYRLRFPTALPNGEKPDPNSVGHATCWDMIDSATEVESELDLLDEELELL